MSILTDTNGSASLPIVLPGPPSPSSTDGRNADSKFLNPYHLPEAIGGALITVEGASVQTTLRRALVGGAGTIVGVRTDPSTGEIFFIRADGGELSIGAPVTEAAVVGAMGYVPYSNNNPAAYATLAQVEAMIAAAIGGGGGTTPPATVWLAFDGSMWLWQDGTPLLSAA